MHNAPDSSTSRFSSSFHPDEAKQLKTIIARLQDILDAGESGIRGREYCIQDLREDGKDLGILAYAMENRPTTLKKKD